MAGAPGRRRRHPARRRRRRSDRHQRGNDLAYGGGGSDTIYAVSGADTLHGDAGFDYLYAGRGPATLAGGDGFDTYYVGWGDGPVTIIDDNADGEGNGLVLYWGSGDGPYKRLDFEQTFRDLDEDGTLTIYLADGSGVVRLDPTVVDILNIYDVGPDLIPGSADDIVQEYRWNGVDYIPWAMA